MKVLDITNITSTVNKYKGLSKPSLFIVNITPPASLGNESVANDLKFFATTANLPGLSFNTEDYRPKGYGLAEPRVTNISQDDVVINFFCDNAGAVQNFFNKWGQKVFNFDHNLSRSTSQGTAYETFGYPDQTWATMDITHYTQANEEINTYNISRVVLKSVGTIQLGWEQNDVIMFLPVTFSYKSWSTKATAANDVKYNTALDSLARQRSASIVNTDSRQSDTSLFSQIQNQYIT